METKNQIQNRELKFRIWDGTKMEHNIMVGFLGTFYVQGMDEKDVACMSQMNTKYYDNIIPMQFTGLKDINGKEIYEGDILSNEVAKWEVVFNKGCFCHKRIGVNIPDRGEDATEMALRGLVGRKIIGNIYENAGLLAVAP